MGTPTIDYVKDKTIEVCLVPIKGSCPIFINLTQIVENNIELLAKWIRDYTKMEAESGVLQARKVAEHHGDNFEAVQDIVETARTRKKCPDYIYHTFEKAEDAKEVPELLTKTLEKHLDALVREIQRRQNAEQSVVV